MISSVSRSRSGWTRAMWSFAAMTLPRAERRSSILWSVCYNLPLGCAWVDSGWTNLYPDLIRETVPQMLKLLIRRSSGHQQTLPVPTSPVSNILLPSSRHHCVKTYPAVNLPTILVPAMVVLQMGITSCNSASKTLHRCQRSCSFARGIKMCSWVVPVKVLARANGDEGVRVRQRREDTDPIPR